MGSEALACLAIAQIHCQPQSTCPQGSCEWISSVAVRTEQSGVRQSCTYMDARAALQIDRQKVKLTAFSALREHAYAMRALCVASALQLAQRPLPALMAIAALLDLPHELWKLRVWHAWRGYTARRLRLQVLAGTMVSAPNTLLLRRTMHAWLMVIVTAHTAATHEALPKDHAALHTAEAESGQAELSGGEDQVERGGKEGTRAHASGWFGVMQACRRVRVVSLLPPLWKEAMEKRLIMEALPLDQQLSSHRLKKRMQTILAIKVRADPLPARVVSSDWHRTCGSVASHFRKVYAYA